jgi:hypothetical protein
VGCGGIDWILLAKDRDRWWALVNKMRGTFLTSCKPVSFSRRTLLHGVSKQASKHLCRMVDCCRV